MGQAERPVAGLVVWEIRRERDIKRGDFLPEAEIQPDVGEGVVQV